ncbi:GNAT family N-acetyltransferase [Tetragenococcus halophilus]|uniref:GNAT family N-acetyltransferase n=3 Tax=Tetragenococcus halophilus TaxID=51669 RepID=A0AB35HRJ3_TETHA|nr:GNAT family N-acetyltransferase [Tetragenococcus halophilus]AOF48074.1 GCN5 family acetyltransferase [Tetragenococcus halophilus]MCF1601816.1 GNAT family N-acetyltransferase [Tetragenococcus halophilus]MCF1675756.1 GNAT family N-acetyltransferase [Tetragenococcus halophilus]MCO7027243.1 GNAT family N-acetyltransferase [Tetragenococcus halophilus]MCO8285024.1 GNAT family N-acetyltransferase [Tetragenococcus halophilus]
MIEIRDKEKITVEDLIEIFAHSGIKRPVYDQARIKRMLDNANILYTAWDNAKLVGVLRGVSDMSYCTFVSDLAVLKSYQEQGVGTKLLSTLRKNQGKNISIVLISAVSASSFYSKVGFEQVENAFKKQRRY